MEPDIVPTNVQLVPHEFDKLVYSIFDMEHLPHQPRVDVYKSSLLIDQLDMPGVNNIDIEDIYTYPVNSYCLLLIQSIRFYAN